MKSTLIRTLVLFGGLLLGVVVSAQDNKALKQQVEKAMGTPVDVVTPTPYMGLIEVQVGGELLYIDKDLRYIVQGNILDAKERRNLTAERSEELARVNFAELPLKLAIKYVKGKGERQIATFEDPNCGYCKRFRKMLQEVDNITVYTFTYNILSQDSIEKSRGIWCSADRSQAWDDWLLKGKVPPAPAADCKAPHEEVLALGRSLRITGTPTTYFANGKRAVGAISKEAFLQQLEAK